MSNQILAPLETVFQNPFQTRTVYTGIEALAESILKHRDSRPETGGLIQVPPARIVIPNGQGWKILNPDEYGGVKATLGDEPEAIIQLAAGHRRHRAFVFLSEDNPDYTAFPVEILILNDEQMADIAWEENNQRKNLTAIEEAEAIERAMAQFGWSQTEIGQRWRLSQPAVANKLRLLKLPDEAREAIRSGQLGERHGRALLKAIKRSPTVYEKAAARILPPQISPEAKNFARHLTDKYGRKNFSDTLKSNFRVMDKICAACHIPIQDSLHQYAWYHQVAAEELFVLCTRCYQSTSDEDWSPPSSNEAESIVANTIRMERNSLLDHHGSFFFDTANPIPGADDPAIVQPTCLGCPHREMGAGEGRDDYCFQTACFTTKQKTWRAYQDDTLKERIAADYDGAEIEIVEGWDGHSLEINGLDSELLAQGVCIPGQCERLRCRYNSYQNTSNLKPYDDLPYIWNCNNTNAHRACQRRYEASQQTEEAQSEAVQQATLIKERKAKGRQQFEQAVQSFVAAIKQQHVGALRAVMHNLRYISNVKGGTYDELFAELVSNTVLRYERDKLTVNHTGWLWGREDANEAYQKTLDEILSRHRVPRLASVQELITKLENTLDFVYGHRIDGQLTVEQLAGNKVNVEKLCAQAEQLNGHLGEKEGNRLKDLFIELTAEIWEAAQEIGYDLPQTWGISWEMNKEI